VEQISKWHLIEEISYDGDWMGDVVYGSVPPTILHNNVFLLGIVDIVGDLCFLFIRGWVSIEIEHLFYPWTRLAIVAAA